MLSLAMGIRHFIQGQNGIDHRLDLSILDEPAQRLQLIAGAYEIDEVKSEVFAAGTVQIPADTGNTGQPPIGFRHSDTAREQVPALGVENDVYTFTPAL